MCPQWPGFKSRNEHASEVSFYEYYNGSAIANSYHYRYYAIRYGPENVPVSGEIHEAGSLILKYVPNLTVTELEAKTFLKQKVLGKS